MNRRPAWVEDLEFEAYDKVWVLERCRFCRDPLNCVAGVWVNWTGEPHRCFQVLAYEAVHHGNKDTLRGSHPWVEWDMAVAVDPIDGYYPINPHCRFCQTGLSHFRGSWLERESEQPHACLHVLAFQALAESR